MKQRSIGLKLFKILPVLILFCLTIIFLHKLVTVKFITIGHVEDHLRILYPYRAFDAEQLKSFSIPLWNPYTFAGFPYLASFRCHIFYPINLMFLILPTHLGMNYSLVLHVFLAGLFMYFLAINLGLDTSSSLVSGLVFMFSGFFIDEVWWGHETVLGSITWTPLVFLLFLRSVEGGKKVYTLLAGFIFAVQIFSGHPQFPYYGLIALFFFMAYLFLYSFKKGEGRRSFVPVLSFLIVVLIGIGLVAIQLIPAAELSQHSIRASSEDTFTFFTRWSMAPSYLMTFVFPRLAPIIGTNSFPFPVALGYIGVLSLMLAVLSLFLIRNKYVLFFWILACFSIILTLGKYTPVYRLFYLFFPGFSAFRNPIFLLYIYVFSVSILAGFGMFYLRKNIWSLSEKKIKIFRGLFIVFGIVLVLIASVVFFMIQSADAKLNSSNLIQAKIYKFQDTLVYDFAKIGFILLLTAIPLILLRKLRSRDMILSTMVIVLIFLDLMAYGTKFIRTYDLTPFVSNGKWVDFLKEEKQPFRVLPILDYPEQDPVLKLNKLSSINGYGSLEIMQDYEDFIAAFQDQKVTQDACLLRVANYDSLAVNILNTKYILTAKKIEDERFPLVFTQDIPAAQTWDPYRKDKFQLNIYENKSVLPRAFVVPAAKVIEKREDVLETMIDPQFDPYAMLILEEEPEESIDINLEDEGKNQVLFTSYKGNEFVLKASLEKGGFLFLSEIHYPGWKAFVDSRERKIYRANYLFRSIYLDKGVHTIRFVFSPFSFKLGALISTLTLSVLIVIFIFCLFRRRTRIVPSNQK